MKHHQLITFFTISFGLLTLSYFPGEMPSQAVNQPAGATLLDSCKCKHANCIKNMITQKESLKTGYENLAKSWEPKWLDPSGKPKSTIDLEKEYATPKERVNVLSVIKSQMDVLNSQIRTT